MERRTDRLTAIYVDAVLNFSERDGRDSTLVALLEYGLPLGTVLRILSSQRGRRLYRMPHSDARFTAS